MYIPISVYEFMRVGVCMYACVFACRYRPRADVSDIDMFAYVCICIHFKQLTAVRDIHIHTYIYIHIHRDVHVRWR